MANPAPSLKPAPARASALARAPAELAAAGGGGGGSLPFGGGARRGGTPGNAEGVGSRGGVAAGWPLLLGGPGLCSPATLRPGEEGM